MPRFARLSSVFGTDVANLDSRAIQAAIDRNESEDLDLDWKEADYPRNEGFELAKDVAAFANTIGGIIIIGVREDGAGRATKSKPFAVLAGAAERVLSILGSRVSPCSTALRSARYPRVMAWVTC